MRSQSDAREKGEAVRGTAEIPLHSDADQVVPLMAVRATETMDSLRRGLSIQ